MNNIKLFILLIYFISISLNASGLRDVKILEASNNIKYISQNIAKNYIYLYINDKKHGLKENIQTSILDLESQIRIIASNTQNKKIKYILDFFAYEKEQIKLIISQDEMGDSPVAVLDFSEAITEGAQNIFDSVGYSFTAEEKMLMKSQNINFLIEKLAKYYMVLSSNIDKTIIEDKADITIYTIKKELEFIERYSYPDNISIKKLEISEFWNSIRYLTTNVRSIRVPSIMLASTNMMQASLESITTYHSKVE